MRKIKFLIGVITLFFAISLCSCASISYVSTFSKHQVELGMSQQEFINKYGNPYNQEISIDDNIKREKLLYKESLYTGDWFIVTTAFYFENNKLIKQEVVKEERQSRSCNCVKFK